MRRLTFCSVNYQQAFPTVRQDLPSGKQAARHQGKAEHVSGSAYKTRNVSSVKRIICGLTIIS